MGNLATKAQGRALQKAAPAKDLAELVERPDVQRAMAAVIPKNLTPERLTQICISAINQTPRLGECSPASVLSCVMKCSQVGLEPSNVNGLGMCYIIPYRNHGRMEAQFQMGYRGYIELARRSGQLKSIHAQAVYDGDEYDVWEDETGQHFKFRANPDAPHGEDRMRYVFCTAHLNDGGFVFEQMSKAEVDEIRKRSKADSAGASPWKTDYEMMARKTVIKRASRYLPMATESNDFQAAAAADGLTPDYSGILQPVIPEVREPAETAVEPPAIDSGGMVSPDAEDCPQEPQTPSETPRVAVCLNCGNVVADLAPDAQAEDIGFACCNAPKYEIREG